MSIEPQNTALMADLNSKGPIYHAKILELREIIESWLSYIPESFPHYTRHTVRHSDEIVGQISKLLYYENDSRKATIPLTPVELYMLAACAYLHDAGMVASEAEKIEILKSDEWLTWIAQDGGGFKRWNDIEKFRKGSDPRDESLRHYLADLEVRFLIAEFIRRAHHLRARTVIDQHQAALGRFAFDDPVLQRTIADICVAHGFRTYELEDQERFPNRRDIRGDNVNVRLLAILLRLGDLLDMNSDRACPLLLNAACPLPANSLAHWTQYQRIVHRLTAPDKIEITAECENQTEHRILQDWCQWIVDEIHTARTLLSRSQQHRSYELPIAEMEGANRTIIIRPSPAARYFPSSWTFELDHEAVFQRLVYDVYEGSDSFVRELIQNGLDANRCQMYADLVAQNYSPPEFPTEVQPDVRSRYPVRLSLKWVEFENPLSQEMERQQVLSVTDSGIGMDKEIIERYFLQVGRSFYVTDEFRRNFRFVPTSRFGVGFLSVFAVSDMVTVETYKPSSTHQDGPIRLTLTGPRNYLLTDVGSRRSPGTEIQVLLREPMKVGRLTQLVSRWCRRVELPIMVEDLDTRTIIDSEKVDDFIYEAPDFSEENATLKVRAFPVNRTGIEGELYVFARITGAGEAWDQFTWAKHQYPLLSPQATPPPFPSTLVCVHGISLSDEDHYHKGAGARIDYRSEAPSITMSRVTRGGRIMSDPNIRSRWVEILEEHLSTSPLANAESGWKYKQRLVEIFNVQSFWESQSGMIPLYIEGNPILHSLNQVTSLSTLATINHRSRIRGLWRSHEPAGAVPLDSCPQPVLKDFAFLSNTHWKAILESRIPSRAYWLNESYLVIDWQLASSSQPFSSDSLERDYLIELPDPNLIGLVIEWKTAEYSGFLNEGHEFVLWLTRVKEACTTGHSSIRFEQFDTLMQILRELMRYGHPCEGLQAYVDNWRAIPGLAREFYPPEIQISREMFGVSD